MWVLHSKTNRVEAYQPLEKGAVIQVYKIDDTLTGEDVLPGFSVAVRDIFRS